MFDNMRQFNNPDHLPRSEDEWITEFRISLIGQIEEWKAASDSPELRDRLDRYIAAIKSVSEPVAVMVHGVTTARVH